MLASTMGFTLAFPDGGEPPELPSSNIDQRGDVVLSDTETEFIIPLDDWQPTNTFGVLVDHDLNTTNSMPDDTFRHRKGRKSF